MTFTDMLLELYRAGPPMRSALKDLIWFYASYINHAVDVGGTAKYQITHHPHTWGWA